MKQIKFTVLFLWGFLFFYGCASSSFLSMQFIPFDNEKHEPQAPEDILIVNSRLELKDKFIEIGVLKIEGQIALLEIRKEAAKNGAQGIIKDGINYTLIIFPDKLKVKHNEIQI